MSLLARGLRRRQSSGAIAVADVFATALYTGNQSTQTITNGIDLAGEGGLVWVKSRETPAGPDHCLVDTLRGTGLWLKTNGTNAQLGPYTPAKTVTAFGSTGFDVTDSSAGDYNTNGNGFNYVSWTFRKSTKFFDVVTFTGNGVNDNRSIQHNLGVQPGCIIIKRYDSTSVWYVWHRAFTSGQNLQLETTGGGPYGNGLFSPSPSATDFTLGGLYASGTPTNINNATYVAYLFAHDPDGVIQCGSYTGNGSTTGPTVTLGWEPQYLLIKNSSATANWVIYDNARDTSNPRTYKLFPNLGNSEDTDDEDIDFTSTGFQPKSTDATINTNGNTYIYMAIKKAA